MITQKHRFHGHNSLKSVYRSGQTIRGPQLTLKFQRRPAGRQYRAAVVVSRKVSKSAVARNRIRRRLYECIRNMEPRFSANFDIVLTVFGEEYRTMDSDLVVAQLQGLLSRAGIIPD